MRSGKASGKWRRRLTIVAVCVTLCTALWIVATGAGLVPGLDFGAGAYYYADIPDFEKYLGDGAFLAALPLWVYILLFLAWGCLMWRLWVRVERRK